MWPLLGTLLAAGPLLPVETPREPVHELRFSWAVDASLTGAMVAGWLLSETALKGQLAPSTCRWCETNPVDNWARGVRAPTPSQHGVATLSDLTDFALLPALALGAYAYLAWSSDALWALPVDLLLIAEATAAAMVVTQLVKFSAGRERPFVAALAPEQKALTDRPSDNHLSFFSGHSSFAFALTIATGTVAGLRGYASRWVYWALALPMAATIPLLRMSADRHYLSDVLVGAAVGAAFGYAIPTWFHGRVGARPLDVRVAPTPGGVAVSGLF